jgi:hypothetical protein
MAIETARGKVPHFSMRPHPVILGALIMIPLIGGLIALSFFAKEDGTGMYQQRGVLTVMITAILSFCLIIVATAKFWYTHLWKKNSTHARHKQHSKYHPAMQEKEFRKQQRR